MQGTAGHVPTALRDLLSAAPAVVEHAYWSLENSVVAQGSLYEAGPFLLPALFEILDRAPLAGSALELLFQIGNATPIESGIPSCRADVIAGLKRWLQRLSMRLITLPRSPRA